MVEMLKGIAASDGVAVAKAYLLVQPDLTFSKATVEDTAAEEARLDAALAKSTEELQQIREKAAQSLGEAEAQVFDAHLMVLSDPEMVGQIKQNIKDNSVNAESALKEVTDMYIGMFEAMEDNAYMQERAADIRDVAKRILAHLLGVTLPNPSMINEEVVVVAHDLTPSDTAQLDRNFVKAFVTDIGGRTSHSAIMARSLEIPAIVGTKEITAKVKEGDILAVNGIEGDVIIDPTDEQKAEFEKAGADYAAQKAEWEKLKNAETVTADGKHFELAANIGTPKDLVGVHNNGGEAVGLYRTEFLYMDSPDFPTEDDQYEAYKAVLEGMEGKPVVVRTMDIGGDKELPYLQLPHEMNPFLGYRALRISLSEQGDEMFRTQMRALLRASVHGNLRIMFPMVATLKEFRAAKAIFEEEKQKLISEGKEVSDTIQVGIMIEIPAAAVLADKFAKEVDFFSVGTNDLIQYTMAADRMNERVSYLYQPYNPSILRLIKNVIDAAHAEGKWAGMCGEMAGDQTAVPLLVGMGLDEFSMSATSILKTRSLMKRLDTAKMAELADRALKECDMMEEVVELVHEYGLFVNK
ncbi:phosphoenolpyruvate--protein phosphotransferase, partial [Enterococcus faecium]